MAIMLPIFLVWLMAYPLARILPDDLFKEPFEHVTGGLNVLFTAFAFGGLVITLLFQSEESRNARREEIERSIFELYETFTSKDFQDVKDSAFRVLLAAVRNSDYAHFVASKLFVVEQLPFPADVETVLHSLDPAKKDKTGIELEHADRVDRLRLDNVLNFFAMLAQRQSSATVIKHCDFAYDWWRPVLWLIGQIQEDRRKKYPDIRQYCRNQLITKTLADLDKIYAHEELKTPEQVWAYVTQHPRIRKELDPRYREMAAGQVK